jgi:hypothetical protein
MTKPINVGSLEATLLEFLPEDKIVRR